MKTLAIVKPDAVQNGSVGFCLQAAEAAGLRITRLHMIRMSVGEAERFYAEHQGKDFFPKLTQFMASGPCVLVELEGEDAVSKWREALKRVRQVEASKEYSERNAVHGSDSPESAARELSFFFI